MDQNPPLATLRDGRLKVTIWENQNEKGETYHTVTPAKTYEDRNGKLQDSHSFSYGELTRVESLIQEAFISLRNVRRDMSKERQHDQRQDRSNPPREEPPRRFHDRSGPSLGR